MQKRGTFLIGRIFKLTISINVSCLAKERCIPEIDNPEKKNIYIYILGDHVFKRIVGFA
jgi:hypothetical protein